MQQKVCSLQILVPAKYETLFPRFGFPAKSSAIFPGKNEALLGEPSSRPGKRGECCVSDRPIELQSLQKKLLHCHLCFLLQFLIFLHMNLSHAKKIETLPIVKRNYDSLWRLFAIHLQMGGVAIFPKLPGWNFPLRFPGAQKNSFFQRKSSWNGKN